MRSNIQNQDRELRSQSFYTYFGNSTCLGPLKEVIRTKTVVMLHFLLQN